MKNWLVGTSVPFSPLILPVRRRGGASGGGLAQYYGTGPGQIPGDWRIDEPTLSGSSVMAVRNDGGAGAAFALSQSGANPVPIREGLFMRTNAGERLKIAATADMVGTHFMAPLQPTADRVAALLWQGGGAEAYYEARLGLFVLRNASGGVLAQISYTPIAAPVIYEMRWDGTTVSLIINGVVVNSATTAPTASWPAKIIGTGTGSARAYAGLIGRCISVIIAPGYTAAAPEPAVLVARQTLAAQYGITLP